MEVNEQGKEWQRYHLELSDGGPVYAETNFNRTIVEPWNAFSSLLFLVPAIYWSRKIRNKLRQHYFLAFCVPLLIMGGLGSTFYHGFRSYPFFLYLDVFPIIVLNLIVGIFFWLRILKKSWHIILIVFPFLLIRSIVRNSFPIHMAINIGYIITGTFVFLPVIINLFFTRFKNYQSITVGILLFLFALFFREIDTRTITSLPMGTHFLWHTFCALGSFYIARYIFVIVEAIPERRKKKSSTISNNGP